MDRVGDEGALADEDRGMPGGAAAEGQDGVAEGEALVARDDGV